ncbi:hypothetical protein V1512DRAFT_231363 [Lipomyces arxii]|uniref:uncharacterized protein n=1 Tax=Lipomyces arxii TaxID=56418 RepID=UPI0034CDE989
MVYYYKTITVVSIWFLLQNLIVSWDASYILCRPHSMPGGKWHWIWSPYKLYGEIDHVYGFPAYEERDGFPAGQAFMTLVEAFFAYVYLYTTHFSKVPKTRLVGAFIGFMAATSCFSKTVLYMISEIFSGNKYVGHNNWFRFIFLYWIPSSPWIIVSFYSAYAISNQLYKALLNVPDEKKTK